ncbi:MAG: succinylglutamate desuccinylase/aspartoacylase family protein [Pseudomonadota bacterium]
MSTSLITSEVDFDADGKQHGYLRTPHSTHRSAYGWIPIPVTVIQNGAGPTVLMMAGIHGDEYEGQIALNRLILETSATDITGRLIVLPSANAPAVAAGTRTSPIDNGNLNRAFPGDPAGSPTFMIAHYIEELLMPLCDYLIDLHSGGTSLVYPPTLLRGQGHDAATADALQGLQTAFDLPYAWVFSGGGGPNSTARTAMGAANRKGVVPIMAELGGGGMVDADILGQTRRGLYRILAHLGVLPEYKPDPARGTRELHVLGSIYSYETGFFEPLKDIGDTVDENECVGIIHMLGKSAHAPQSVVSPYKGIVLCKRALAQVEPGDAMFQIATDASI